MCVLWDYRQQSGEERSLMHAAAVSCSARGKCCGSWENKWVVLHQTFSFFCVHVIVIIVLLSSLDIKRAGAGMAYGLLFSEL